MRKPSLDDAEILAAGDSLKRDGKAVNGWSLRAILGSGRPDRLMSVYESLNGGSDLEASSPSIPPVVADLIDKAVKKHSAALNSLLRDVANASATAAHGEFAERLAELARENDRLVSSQEDAVQFLQSFEDQLSSMHKERSGFLEQIQSLSDALDKSNDVKAEQALSLTLLQAKVDDLQRAVDAKSDQLKCAGDESIRLQERCDSLSQISAELEAKVDLALQREQRARDAESQSLGKVKILESLRTENAEQMQRLRKSLSDAENLTHLCNKEKESLSDRLSLATQLIQKLEATIGAAGLSIPSSSVAS